MARISASSGIVRWSGINQPFRAGRDYSSFGPFEFEAREYFAILARLAPVWDEALP
jgi:hypothetical protein